MTVRLPFLVLAALVCGATVQAQVFDEEAVRGFFQHALLDVRFAHEDPIDVEFLPGIALSDGAHDIEEVTIDVVIEGDATFIRFVTPHSGADFARILTFENETLTILPIDDYADGEAATFVTRERMSPEQFQAHRSGITGTWRLHRIGSFDASVLGITFDFGSDGQFLFDARRAATLGDEAFAGAPAVLDLLVNQGTFEAFWHPSVGAYRGDDGEARRLIVWHRGHDVGTFRIVRIADGELLLEVDGEGQLDLRRVN